MSEFVAAGIIAAGHGSRLQETGRAKPLVSIAGRPLLAYSLDNLREAGLRRLAVIFNESETDCAEWLERESKGFSLTVIVRTTASSLESFGRVLAALPPGRVLLSTVDSICPPADFVRFVRNAERAPADEFVLGVTTHVDDEKPLWVTIDAEDRITAIGERSGNAVTAGYYGVPASARGEPVPPLPRLRDYLAWTLARGISFRAVALPRVVDVDRPEDVRQAESDVRSWREKE